MFDGYYASKIMERLYDIRHRSGGINLISGNDQKRTPIHVDILRASSLFFSRLLYPDPEEKKHTEFLFKDTDVATIETIVHFFYTDAIDLTHENAVIILNIASSYEMDMLVDKCHQFYMKKLSIDNAVSTLKIADEHCLADLRKQALDLICDNFSEVPAIQCQQLSYSLLRELLKNGNFGNLHVTRLLEWFQYDEDGRCEHMPELIKLIQWDQLTQQFLDDTFEEMCHRFGTSSLVLAKHERWARIAESRSSTYCLSQSKDLTVYIEKYNHMEKRFDGAIKTDPRSRLSCNYEIYESKIFMLGGIEQGEPMNSVSYYDLNSMEVLQLPGMNVARSDFASIVVGKHIYVFGGSGVDGPLNSCERFDMENQTWEIIKSMDVRRSSAAAAFLNGYIYVTGGLNHFYLMEKSVELYTPDSDSWSQAFPSHYGRMDFVLAESDGYLYAMGNHKAIERFEPCGNYWTELESLADSFEIVDAIDINRDLFVIMKDGQFGRIHTDRTGKFSFEFLALSELEGVLGNRRLYHVQRCI